ncbi:putative ubiquitin thioesterase protein [Phaeoacremonium minimum UCRPA7]|uniref:ubiquitinyl hydrolase 1 n=1 Tax=Phaeoacremonium minimum (strain UCR-PA7) TaxID=1286976 RepID=R8BQQ7_PHAM7|nr:putative ubiquitin thioesterase protein [Phaeoacremonium minimum UCRPA7]EOO01664.1 putative ubiquitin thioesterase protein [Phaeoacremonium minimum UCRPA7]
MEPNTQDDLAAQEAAAREYRPKLQGPLIGEKMPSHVITEEYAKADQVYVAKTIALPETYSSYRPVQGDGNCGWRAIGYGYFETLIQQGDVALVQSELQRLTALNQYLSSVGGYDDMVYEPMSEETIELLGDIAANMVDPLTAMSILTNKFNDPNSANSIIYHLRLLAASWLRENAETYEAFTAAEGGIQPYCNDVLERVDREIEHLGIVSLIAALVAKSTPIDFPKRRTIKIL